MTKHHYVYHSYEEWGREYVGIRSCDCLPEEDTKYFGSFYDKSFKPTGKNILFVCKTRKEASEIEIKLHDFFDVAINPKFANKAKATSSGFNRAGVLHTEESKKRMSETHTGKPRTEETKKKISESLSDKFTGEKNHQFGNTGALNHGSKAVVVIKPDGTELHFGSIIEATKELGVSNHHNLSSRYLKTGKSPRWGKFKDWKFIYATGSSFAQQPGKNP